MKNFPDKKEAIQLWLQSVGNINKRNSQAAREYIFHSSGVAEAAAKISKECGLDAEKAYILGLLHDWGKIESEKETRIPHFWRGYNKMMEENWSDVAQICLSHSFPEKDFNIKDYPSYKEEDLIKAKQVLSSKPYDDYDKLIQLCDMFFEGVNIVSYQNRLQHIRQRYNLALSQTLTLSNKARSNKAYFDGKCGKDIYEILNIKY